MPAIRIEISDQTDRATMLRIRDSVKKAVLVTLAPKETKFDYVTIYGVVAEYGDGIPLITVDLRPGREAVRKKALVDAIAAILKNEIGVTPEDIYVLFREIPASNHFTGGIALKEWVPANRLEE
ncbi:MAG: tautomerase family protein [Rhizobiales bacterium]|nr:tautomerase family protein [Hyphomicrobiales bacterium]